MRKPESTSNGFSELVSKLLGENIFDRFYKCILAKRKVKPGTEGKSLHGLFKLISEGLELFKMVKSGREAEQ